MKLKHFSGIAIALLLTFTIQSQLFAQFKEHKNASTHPSDANIIGQVVEAKTGENIPGITIQIKGTRFGSTTNADGHYFITRLKPGNYTLVMRGVGFLSQEKQVTVEANKIIEINFEAEQDLVQFDEVVVTADRHETLRRVAPVVVGVIDEKIFARTNAQNVLQGLSFQPGLRVENNCQNCGFNQVRINGLEGKYSQILIDSRPIFSALAGIYGLEQIPTSMVDRIEVVRGGGSALYGSNAIGGVINVITKMPTSNSANVTETLSLTGISKPDNTLGFDASIVSRDNKAGLILYGQARSRSGWDKDGDGFTELGKLQSKSIGANTFVKLSELARLSGEIHTIHEYRRGGDHLDYPDHVAAISERLQHEIYGGNVKLDAFSPDLQHYFSLYSSAQSVNRSSYYGGIGSWADVSDDGVKTGSPVPPENYGTNFGITKGFTVNSGLQYTYDIANFFYMPAQILLGVEHTYDQLSDRTPIREWTPSVDENGNPIIDDDGSVVSAFPALNQKLNIFSQIAQIEWKNDIFGILLGGRLDEHSLVSKPIFSPRATLRYNPIKDINFRATYAKGFRAPQIFDEELHVGYANGEQKKIFNAKDLKPEHSHAFTLSSDIYGNWGEFRGNLLLEGFYNRLQNIFVDEETDQIVKGFRYYERQNSKGAKIYGLNIEGRLVWRMLQLQGGLSLVSHKYDEAVEWGSYVVTEDGRTLQEGGMPKVEDGAVVNEARTSKEMIRTPNVYGYLTFNAEITHGLNLSLNANLYGPMHVPHSIVYGAGAALSDIAAKNDADTYKDYFDRLGVNEEDGSRDIRIDRLEKSPAMVEFGAKISYEMHIRQTRLELNLGVNNIFNAYQKDFDRGADRDSAYIYGPLAPRTMFFGVKFMI